MSITAAIVLATIYTIGTIAVFTINILEWSLEREFGRTETAAHHARLALNAWAWPAMAAIRLRDAARDANQ